MLFLHLRNVSLFLAFTERHFPYTIHSQKNIHTKHNDLQKSLTQRRQCTETMDEWGAVMRIESNDNGQTLDVVKASLKLKSTVSIERIIQERVKHVKEFKELGFLNQHRHVTNLANEMQLRLVFFGHTFRSF